MKDAFSFMGLTPLGMQPFEFDGSYVVCNGELCGFEKLIAGVEKRLVADAKTGFLLSGGLDSSLVCAIAAKKSDQAIQTKLIQLLGT